MNTVIKFRTVTIIKLFFYILCLPIILFFEPGFTDLDVDKATQYVIILLMPIALVTAFFAYQGYDPPIKSSTLVHVKRIAFTVFVAFPLNMCAFIVLIFGLNIALDDRERTHDYNGIVTKKDVSGSSKSRIYSIYIQDEKHGLESHFYVQRGHYNNLNVGDKTSLKFYAGKFGIPWRYESVLKMF